MYSDMYSDECTGRCIGMCIDMCLGMHVGMRIYRSISTCVYKGPHELRCSDERLPVHPWISLTLKTVLRRGSSSQTRAAFEQMNQSDHSGSTVACRA